MPFKILIVDDIPQNLSVVAQLLQAAGYEVCPASSGPDALALAAAEPPDLVLLDIRMPGMDGFTVCDRLKANPATADVPVIFLSASGDLSDKLVAFRHGGADYVEKPFHAQEVLARVQAQIQLRQARADLRAAHAALEAQVAARTAELARREARYGRLVENSPSIIYSRAEDGRFLYANGRLQAVLGHDPAMLRSNPDLWRSRIHPDDRAAFDRKLAAPSTAAGAGLEYRVRAANGTWRWLDDRVFGVERAPDGGLIFDGIATEVTERVEQARLMASLAYSDTLTGLANRKRLQEHLDALLANPQAEPFALLLLDLDRFKEINDAVGHHAGDRLLILLAARLRAAVGVDSGLVARLGGDEFAILLHRTGQDEAEAWAAAILTALKEPFTVEGMRLEVSGSLGIACHPRDGASTTDLLRCADVAMYFAKRTLAGYATYSSRTDTNSPAHLALVSEFSDAIADGQMELHYQPQVFAATGAVAGLEALVRWRHPQHGLLLPGRFLPLIELSDQVRRLSYWVIDTAVGQIAAWRRDGLSPVVAINLSARNLVDETLPQRIAAALARERVPAHQLEVEITETAMMIDPERSVAVLQRIVDQGVKLAVDDFGTGYSSFALVRRLPRPAALKIDRSFVVRLAENGVDAAIVGSMLSLVRSLGARAIAEGVEDADTLAVLTAMGCDMIQGYHVSRPLPAAEAHAWLRERQGAAASSRRRIEVMRPEAPFSEPFLGEPFLGGPLRKVSR